MDNESNSWLENLEFLVESRPVRRLGVDSDDDCRCEGSSWAIIIGSSRGKRNSLNNAQFNRPSDDTRL